MHAQTREGGGVLSFVSFRRQMSFAFMTLSLLVSI